MGENKAAKAVLEVLGIEATEQNVQITEAWIEILRAALERVLQN